MNIIPTMRYAFLFSALLLLFSCGEDPSSPEGVTRQFVTLLGNGDFEGAKKLGTENTERFIAFRAETMAMMGEDPVQPVDVQKISCISKETSADCLFCCDQNNGEMQVPLVKVNGTWLVDISIDHLLKEFEEELEKLEEIQQEE